MLTVSMPQADPMRVWQVMTRTVVTVKADATLADAAALMREHHIGALPVLRTKALVGIITVRDITIRAREEGLDIHRALVGEAMTPRISFVPPDFPLSDAAHLMRSLRLHRLAVVDGELRLVGILSMTDLPAELRPASA